MAGVRRDFVGLAADDSAETLAKRGERPKKNSRSETMYRLHVGFGWHQCHADACQDDDAANRLGQRWRVAEPKPFDDAAEGRGEALNDDNRSPRADARIGLEHGKVANAKADAAAD